MKRVMGVVKFNGSHYFAGESVFGRYIEEEGKAYIINEWEDDYGNEFKDKIEVHHVSVETIEENNMAL